MPVRLSQLPLSLRLAAARRAAVRYPDEALSLLAAAIHPRPEHDLHYIAP